MKWHFSSHLDWKREYIYVINCSESLVNAISFSLASCRRDRRETDKALDIKLEKRKPESKLCFQHF